MAPVYDLCDSRRCIMIEEDSRPTCRKCGTLVQQFQKDRSFRDGRVSFASICHGATDEYAYWPATSEGVTFVPKHAFPHDLPGADAVRSSPPPMPTTILTVQEELVAMPAWKRVKRIEHFASSVRLLERNASALVVALNTLVRDPRSFHLVAVAQRATLDAALEEVLHLLHNFVAAALTLVDHTRVLYKDLYSISEFPDYQAEIEKRFSSVPLIQFVKCLRQFAQHVRLPHVSFKVELKQGAPPVRHIFLSKQDLETFDSWNAVAKQYLQSAPESINLDDIVQDYIVSVREFYGWMMSRQSEIHSTDYEVIARKQKEGVSLLAADIPGILECGLQIHDAGGHDVTAIFAPCLSTQDWLELSSLTGDKPAWVERALKIVENRFGVLPVDLVTRVRAANEKTAER